MNVESLISGVVVAVITVTMLPETLVEELFQYIDGQNLRLK